MGGRGTVFGACLGALIMASLDNGMSLLNVRDFMQDIIKGSILVAAVGLADVEDDPIAGAAQFAENAATGGGRRDLPGHPTLPDAWGAHQIGHTAVTADRTVDHGCYHRKLPAPPDETGLGPPDGAMPVDDAQQPLGGHGLRRALDPNPLDVTQDGCVLDQSGRRHAQHDPARRRDGLHPLGHPDLCTDCGVAELTRADAARDHLAGVQPDPQSQLDTVAFGDLDSKPHRLLLNVQGRQAGSDGVVLQGDGSAEHRHDPVARPLCDRAAVPLDNRRAAVGEAGHDLAQPLRAHCRGNLHRVHHVGEQHRHLLVLGRWRGSAHCRSAFVAELEGRGQSDAAGAAHPGSCWQFGGRLNAVHAVIVSPQTRS